MSTLQFDNTSGFLCNQTNFELLLKNFDNTKDVKPQIVLMFENLLDSIKTGHEYCKKNQYKKLILKYSPVLFLECFCRHYIREDVQFFGRAYRSLNYLVSEIIIDRKNLRYNVPIKSYENAITVLKHMGFNVKVENWNLVAII